MNFKMALGIFVVFSWLHVIASAQTDFDSSSLVQSSSTSEYSLLDQQPVTRVPYAGNPNSISSKRLPLDVMKHLAPNSDSIAINVLEDNGGWGPLTWDGGSWGSKTWSTPGPNDCCDMPLYYATASDPWYVVTGCDYGPTTNTGPWSPIGIPFHAPDGTEFNQSTTDNYLAIWDQSQNYLVEFYGHDNPGQSLPACDATNASNACPIHMHSCAMAKFDTGQDWGGTSTTRPGGFGPFMGVIRMHELMAGEINHALYVDLDCVVGPPVFPDVVNSMAWACGVPPAPEPSNRPREGSLFFLDYSDAQIANMNIPQWQKTVLTAFAHYGAYAGTTGLGGETLNPYMESGQAYQQQGLQNPFVQWAASQSGVIEGCDTNDCRYTFRFLDRVPWVNGPTCPADLYPNGCDLSHHMHIADPCVAAGLANQPANASTPPCVFSLKLQSSGAGAITVSSSGTQRRVTSTATAYVGKGTFVTLAASPDAGSTFSGWTGACSGTNSTCTIQLQEATAVTASFR
jgi:hypothetical protein